MVVRARSERNFWIFCTRAHESEKKLRSRSRSPPDERTLGAPLKWAALTKALQSKDSIYYLWNRVCGNNFYRAIAFEKLAKVLHSYTIISF